MAFEIVEIPSGGLFIKGHLIQKKLTAKSKRMVFLCFPKSLKDVQFLFEELKSGTNQNQAKDMEIYGHISLAAISGKWLLGVTNLWWMVPHQGSPSNQDSPLATFQGIDLLFYCLL